MAIRLRDVNGTRVALCAVESDPMPGDIYLDDRDHYALSAKFCRDFCPSDGKCRVEYPEEWSTMETQKVRDAEEEMDKWHHEVERLKREEGFNPERDVACWDNEKHGLVIESRGK
jgi:hypothetical protein